jgi:integrase
MLFDWMVTSGVLATNPAASVRGRSHALRRGRTPALTAEQARRLLDAIDGTSLVGLRGRALIGVMLYAMARVGAATALRVSDVEVRGRRTSLRLNENGGRVHDMPAHHVLEDALDAYLDAAGIAEDRAGWLFRAVVRRTGALTARPLAPRNAHHMIRRRADTAGIALPIGCHSLRATGITAYLAAGGTLEMAQRMAGHANPRTTALYASHSAARPVPLAQERGLYTPLGSFDRIMSRRSNLRPSATNVPSPTA